MRFRFVPNWFWQGNNRAATPSSSQPRDSDAQLMSPLTFCGKPETSSLLWQWLWYTHSRYIQRMFHLARLVKMTKIWVHRNCRALMDGISNTLPYVNLNDDEFHRSRISLNIRLAGGMQMAFLPLFSLTDEQHSSRGHCLLTTLYFLLSPLNSYLPSSPLLFDVEALKLTQSWYCYHYFW